MIGEHNQVEVFVGLDHYGASAAYTVIYEQFGLTEEAVVAAARESLQAVRSGTH